MNNIFQMNDWKIKEFLAAILAVQFAMWGVIGLDAVGLQIPILRQLIAFIYLTFVPGIIILRILKLHKLGNIETILYTVGLSIATLMFTGFFMSIVYPLFDISRPISLLLSIITISIVVSVLCILSYVSDKNFSEPDFIAVNDVLSPSTLFLCMVPFFAIFGTYLVNICSNNIILMFLIVMLATMVVLIALDKFIPRKLYPLAVFIISITLLFHRTLISMYIVGWDVHYELYLSNLVKANNVWDLTIPNNCNAMLSVVILPTIYSIISNIDTVWAFKIIYPLLFTLVPLGLYHVFQKQTNDTIAFLSCFFFVSFFEFYFMSPGRQWIAEIFLVLLVLLMIDKGMNKMRRAVLCIVFGISLAVSHYGASYIYMFSLTSAWLILILADNPTIKKLINKNEIPFGDPIRLKTEGTMIYSTFILLVITFTVAWYMYVSSSSVIDTIIQIGGHIASTIFTDFLDPRAAQGLNMITKETVSPLHSVDRCLHLITQFFIFVGLISLIYKQKEIKFEREYKAFSYVYFAICLGGIVLPYFASALNTARLYHIALIFLAPFCVIGEITVFKMISKVAKESWTSKSARRSLMALSIYLAIFLLFNSSWVYEVAKDHPGSISLNSTIDSPVFNDQEILGAMWLHDVKDDKLIYADAYRWLLLSGLEWGTCIAFPDKISQIFNDSYIYFGTRNVVNDEVAFLHEGGYEQRTKSNDIAKSRNEVYANGGAEIYTHND